MRFSLKEHLYYKAIEFTVSLFVWLLLLHFPDTELGPDRAWKVQWRLCNWGMVAYVCL